MKNLIGISGKIGSGKDTVGKIIQYLVHNDKYPGAPITAVEFLKGRKDYYEAGIIGDEDYLIDQRSGWQIKKFAQKLKQIASILTGVPQEKWEDQEFKKGEMGGEWERSRWYADNRMRVGLPEKKGALGTFNNIPTYREFLQELGTEALRDVIHPDIWVNAMFTDYKSNTEKYSDGDSEEYRQVLPKWIITDMRFPNEFEAIKAKGGITVRMARGHYYSVDDRGWHIWDGQADGNGHRVATPPEFTKEEAYSRFMTFLKQENQIHGHISETAIDTDVFDVVIDNNGTIEELIEKVKDLLTKLKIIE